MFRYAYFMGKKNRDEKKKDFFDAFRWFHT